MISYSLFVIDVFQSLGLSVVYSENGLEYVNPQLDTVFVLYEFSGEQYETLYLKEARIIGYPAFLDIVRKKRPIPDLDRPLFSVSMEDVITCFTGFRNREKVVSFDQHSLLEINQYKQKINTFISVILFRTGLFLVSTTWEAVSVKILITVVLPT